MSDIADQNARVLDQFAQQADAYAALVKPDRRPALDPLIEAAHPTPDDIALDVGCGPGHLAVALAPFVKHATGVDLTPAMLAKARAHQQDSGATNITWQQADATALPFPDATFSLVVSRAMFHHAADPAATLREMIRVAGPCARIAINDLTPPADKSPAFDAIELLRDPSHAHALPADELRALGASLGLRELMARSCRTELPIEAVLATSFPAPGMLERVRALYARDAANGTDAFGMRARLQDGAVWVAYPMTLVVWAGMMVHCASHT